MKYCVLLPAYDEFKNIAAVIKEIRTYGLDVIVVDDGSTDNTAQIARQEKAIVISHDQNLGKGQALRTGFDYAIKNDYYAVIIMDADGQHDPQEIPHLIQYAQDSKAGLIIGNRMHRPEGMPLLRWITNMFTSHFVSRIIGYKIPDSQCGYRLIKTAVLKQINLSTIKYDTESEILIEAAKSNFKIESMSIKSIYTNQKSQIHPVIDTIRFIKLISKHLFKK